MSRPTTCSRAASTSSRPGSATRARAFLAHDGLVRVDTWVDTTRDGPSLVTVLGFRDEDALERFLDDPATDLLGQKFDDFIGPLVFRRPPVYHATALSAP